jgi:CPA1 family monovalent cation:H+ antiporter
MLALRLPTLLGLLFAVVAFALTARRLRLPYPSLLALGGLILALVPRLPRLQLAPDIVLFVFLPPLLFSAGWRIPWPDFAALLRPITVLAIGLVLLTTIGVALVAHALEPSLPLASAIVLGAIVSPTDPLAASAVARRVRLPRAVITLLEGESLANDATGLVMYRIALGFVAVGHLALLHGAYTFVVIAAGGIAVGLVLGLLSVLLQRVANEPAIAFAIQLATGYMAYLLAEQIGFSGVFAAAAAGMLCGHFFSYALHAESRLLAVTVWDTLDFLLNATLFLLLGLQLPVVLAQIERPGLGHLLLRGLLLSGFAIALRMVWLLVSTLRTKSVLPLRLAVLVGWSGMRGVLSLATALALPTLTREGPFAGRATIIFYAFCVIVVTLIGQGLALPLLIRFLRIPREETPRNADSLARLQVARTARDALTRLSEDGDTLTRELVEELRPRYIELLECLESEGAGPESERRRTERARIRGHVIAAQRRALLDLYRGARIDSDTFRKIERELDLEEQART